MDEQGEWLLVDYLLSAHRISCDRGRCGEELGPNYLHLFEISA